MDYLHMEHGLGRNRQNIADREGPRAEYDALLGQLKEAAKFHDREHEESILKHWAHYIGRVEGTSPAWDYSDDEAQAALEKRAFYNRHHITREQAYPEASEGWVETWAVVLGCPSGCVWSRSSGHSGGF